MIPDDTQIKNAMQNAPAYIKDFLRSTELSDIFNAIRKERALHLDDTERLSRVIVGASLEIIPLQSVTSSIEKALEKVSPEIKQEVIKDVNERVFEELRLWALAEKELENEEKMVSENPTHHTPNPMPAPQNTERKLYETTKEISREVQLSAPKEVRARSIKKPYDGTDPYREPIE